MMNRLDEIEKSLGDSTLLLSSFHSYLQGGQDLGLALHSRKLIREALAFDSKSEEVRVFVTLQSQPLRSMCICSTTCSSLPGRESRSLASTSCDATHSSSKLQFPSRLILSLS